MSVAVRRPTSIPIDAALADEARAYNLDLSRAAERGIREALAQARSTQSNSEHAEAIARFNRYVEEHGLPLAKHRPW